MYNFFQIILLLKYYLQDVNYDRAYLEINERFYKDLEFGTAGLRGKIGAGTNRMNKYIISITI